MMGTISTTQVKIKKRNGNGHDTRQTEPVLDKNLQKIKTLPLKNGCRKIHHSIHSPHLELEYCKNCDAHVQVRAENKCSCCDRTIPKFLTHTWLSRVLKFGVKQHHNFIRDWNMWPNDLIHDGERFLKIGDPTWLEIKYRDTVYEIPAKYLALALEPIEEKAKLDIIKSHIGIKGFRVWIPEDEEIDLKCERCGKKMMMRKDKMFCTVCDHVQ